MLQAGSLPKFIYEEIFAAYQARITSSEEDLRNLYNQRITTSPAGAYAENTVSDARESDTSRVEEEGNYWDAKSALAPDRP